jgi:hypothetical protein
MWLLWLLLLLCACVLTGTYLIAVALHARDQRVVEEKCLRADFHAAHEAIPINEERRERELSQLRAIWSLS